MPHMTNEEIFTVATLFYINGINYMDRYCIAGILEDLQKDFKIGDDYAGLLQTGFILSLTIFAPIFGYIGDNYPRRFILLGSVLFSSAATLTGSFMSSYAWFFCMRTCTGIGQASFTSIAPTVIYDVSVLDHRKTTLAAFFIAIPIGIGMGYMITTKIAYFIGHWSWAMRVTPALGAIGCVLLFFTKDPIRGERECLAAGSTCGREISSYKVNIIALSRNRSFLLMTFGFTSVTFVTGALAWWGPKLLQSGFRLIPGEEVELDEVVLQFGTLTIFAGIFGVPLGAFISNKLIMKYPKIDPIICGVVLILGAPLIITALFTSNRSVSATIYTVFIAQLLMNTTWALVTDIVLSVVVPEARATAQALQIAFAHALGDAGSPYIVGLISEVWKNRLLRRNETSAQVSFEALRLALSSIVIMQLIGGILFGVDAVYIVEDRQYVIQTIAYGNGQCANPTPIEQLPSSASIKTTKTITGLTETT